MAPLRLLAAGVALTVTLGACTGTPSGRTPTAAPAPSVAASPAPQPTTDVAFRADRLEDAGWIRNDEVSDPTRLQYQDARCVVQLVVLPASGPHDDAGDTELALEALGMDLADPADRPDVAVPAADGTVALRARRVMVDTGSEVLAMQVGVRVLGSHATTVAVTHACYDHPVTDEEFDAVIALLELTGVEPGGF